MILKIPPKDIEEALEPWIRENLGDEVAQKVKSFTFVVDGDGDFEGVEVELE